MMNTRKLAKILCIAVVALAFISAPLYAAPNNGKSNSGKSKAQVNKPAKNSRSNKALKTVKIKSNRGQRISKEQDASLNKNLRPNIQKGLDRHIAHNSRKNEKRLIRDLNQALIKLNNARWSYHPNDDRGQGNMGKVDMLDPYGFNKDSDRMELYGNRGRVIREIVEPEPDPIPDPEPEPDPIPDPEPEPDPDPEPPDFPF